MQAGCRYVVDKKERHEGKGRTSVGGGGWGGGEVGGGGGRSLGREEKKGTTRSTNEKPDVLPRTHRPQAEEGKEERCPSEGKEKRSMSLARGGL